MMKIFEDYETSKLRRYAWDVVKLVNTTVLTYGLQCGWVSPMTKILQSEQSPIGRPLTDAEISLIASIPSLSAIIGIPILLYVVDNYGRKSAVMVMAIFLAICWLIKVCAVNRNSLIIARVFCGLGAGGCFSIVPMYIKEISQDNIRGTLGSMFILFQNLGIFIMYGIGSYLGYNTVLYITTAISLFTIAMLFKAPESPSFLVKRKKFKEAVATIAYLRGLGVNDKEVQSAIELIKKEDEYFKSIPKVSFLTIFKEKAWRRGFIIMGMLLTMHGLNGTFCIVTYASNVLENSEMAISPELQSLAIPVFLLIGTGITMISVDKLGRKAILGTAFGITAVAFSILATNQLLNDHGWATPTWLPIIAILLTMCSYGAAISPLPFMILAEMFNFQIRGKIMSFLVGMTWFLTFTQLVAFPVVSNTLGIDMTFYIFSAINLTGVLLVLFLLPETSGKTVEEIEAKLKKEKHIGLTTTYC